MNAQDQHRQALPPGDELHRYRLLEVLGVRYGETLMARYPSLIRSAHRW